LFFCCLFHAAPWAVFALSAFFPRRFPYTGNRAESFFVGGDALGLAPGALGTSPPPSGPPVLVLFFFFFGHCRGFFPLGGLLEIFFCALLPPPAVHGGCFSIKHTRAFRHPRGLSHSSGISRFSCLIFFVALFSFFFFSPRPPFFPWWVPLRHPPLPGRWSFPVPRRGGVHPSRRRPGRSWALPLHFRSRATLFHFPCLWVRPCSFVFGLGSRHSPPTHCRQHRPPVSPGPGLGGPFRFFCFYNTRPGGRSLHFFRHDRLGGPSYALCARLVELFLFFFVPVPEFFIAGLWAQFRLAEKLC